MPIATGDENTGMDTSYDFEEMKLQVGSRLQLQISSEQNSERHLAKYLGHIKGVSLLVTTPIVDEKVLFIREGQNFVVRAFSGKTALASRRASSAPAMSPPPICTSATPSNYMVSKFAAPSA